MKVTEESFRSPVRMAFMGGCHVLGFMVGKENSFVNVCKQQFQDEHIDSEVDVFPYFNLKRAKDATEVCSGKQLDILIVQCHYIFNPNLRKRIEKRLKRKSKKESKPYNPHAQFSDYRVENTDATFVPTLNFWIRQYTRHFFHSLLFYKVVNKKECLSYIDRFFSALRNTDIKNVIVLGPFPSTDLVLNRYRKMGVELLNRKCAEYGFDFIDVYSIIQNEYSDQIFTIDDIHLNKEAHLFLGKNLAKYLIEHKLQRTNPTIRIVS